MAVRMHAARFWLAAEDAGELSAEILRAGPAAGGACAARLCVLAQALARRMLRMASLRRPAFCSIGQQCRLSGMLTILRGVPASVGLAP